MHKSRSILRLSCASLLFVLGATAFTQTHTRVAVLLEQSENIGRESRLAKISAEQRARALGIPIRQVFPDGTTVELMRFENGMPIYYSTDNVNAAISTATDKVHPGGGHGFTLTGQGMIMGIWDGGRVRPTHQEFGGRAISKDGASNSSHATHVGGTMAAAGTVAAAKGMAFQAILHSYSYSNDTSEMLIEAADGLMISNHSYSDLAGWRSSGGSWYWYGDPSLSQTQDWKFGFYSNKARQWDEMAFNAPYYLICKSAGNTRNGGPQNQPTGFYWNGSSWVANQVARDLNGAPHGYNSIVTYTSAKNILSVAAVNDVVGGYNGPGSVTMSSFSSWGPTDDGRIKPDISANGVQLYSSSSGSNSSYSTSSGTSMSTPNAAGSLILLQQHYQNLFAGQNMRAATLKGLAIHTADECGPNPGPDYMFGWGLLNTLRGAETITRASIDPGTINELVLTQGGSQWYVVYSTGNQPLRATISWTDRPGTVHADQNNNPTPKLVNDLDLKISRFDGVVFQPWILNPNNPQAAAVPGDDSINNMEMVHIEDPLPGYYIVRVTHKGNLVGGSQAYSRIITGNSLISPSNLNGSRGG